MTPEEGDFPKTCSWFYDAFKKIYGLELNGLIRHMLCDRLKLRSEFYFNPTTNYCDGIVVQFHVHVVIARY